MNNSSSNRPPDKTYTYDSSLGLDDVDGINALLSTGDAQLDLEDLDSFKFQHDPTQSYGNYVMNEDDARLLWKNSNNTTYDDNSRSNRPLPTLGQMADQIQAKARAEGRNSGSFPITKESVEDTDGGDEDNEDEEDGTATGQEHTGRWTREEHDLFLKALEKYGKEWKKVASMVKTRTVVQTRTHAQKYFQKQMKSGENLGGFDYSTLDASPVNTTKISPTNTSMSSNHHNNSNNSNINNAISNSDYASTSKRSSGLTLTIPSKKSRRYSNNEAMTTVTMPSSSSSSAVTLSSSGAVSSLSAAAVSSASGDETLSQLSQSNQQSSNPFSQSSQQNSMQMHSNQMMQNQLNANPMLSGQMYMMSGQMIPNHMISGQLISGQMPSQFMQGNPMFDQIISSQQMPMYGLPHLRNQTPPSQNQAIHSAQGSMNHLTLQIPPLQSNQFARGMFDSPNPWPGNSWSSLPPPPPSESLIPQPSPAATGRRKHAELAVAATLAESATQDLDGASVLSMLHSGPNSAPSTVIKSTSATSNSTNTTTTTNNTTTTSSTNPTSGMKVKRSTSLTIINPDLLNTSNNTAKTTLVTNSSSLPLSSAAVTSSSSSSSSSFSTSAINTLLNNSYDSMLTHGHTIPGTPWENDIKSLVFPKVNKDSSSEDESALFILPPTPIVTPTLPSLTKPESEFIDDLRKLLSLVDFKAINELLDTFSATIIQSYTPNGTPNVTIIKSQISLGTTSNKNNESTNLTTPRVEHSSHGVNSSNNNNNNSTNSSPYHSQKPLSYLLNRPYNLSSSNLFNDLDAKNSSTNIIIQSQLQSHSHSQLQSPFQSTSPGNYILLDFCEKVSDSVDQHTVQNICSTLIDHGASVHSVNPSTGQSCLHVVAKRGYDHIGRYLLNKGCQINLCDNNGDTAFHIASKYGHKAFVAMLLELGAHCHVHNHNAMSALDLAGSECMDKVTKRLELRSHMFEVEPRLRTLVLYHDDCLAHTSRRITDWEGPDRLIAIMDRLRNKDLFPHHELEISSNFERASVDLLSRVHSSDYIAFVNNLSQQLIQQQQQDGSIASEMPFTPQVQKLLYNQSSEELKQSEYSDTTFSVGTLQAARRAAGAVAHAVDRILLGRNRNAFCCIRPPGHHAGHRGLLDGNAKSCGFCIFNSVAAGAFHALEVRHCQRVAIVDLDVHHGNGTEDIVKRFHEPSRLFFFSLHLYDKDPAHGYEFFPGSGANDDVIHNIINVPMIPLWYDKSKSPTSSTSSSSTISIHTPQGVLIGRDGYRQAILQRLLPSLRAFNPSLILLSTGFDAAAGDIGNQRNVIGANGVMEKGIDLLPEDFEWITTEIMRVADICCNGRLVSVLEGGYGCIASSTQHKPRTRESHKNSSNGSSNISINTNNNNNNNNSNNSYNTYSNCNPTDGFMNRSSLANGTVAHVRRLVDPYENI